MAKTIGASVTDVTRSASLVVLCLGIGAILSAPLARIYGKRPGKTQYPALLFLFSLFFYFLSLTFY